MNLPPIFQTHYTDGQRRYIAGFILIQRAGVLQAIDSLRQVDNRVLDQWKEKDLRYYQDAESFTRFLLDQLGYPVEKNQMYHG